MMTAYRERNQELSDSLKNIKLVPKNQKKIEADP